MKGFSTLDNPSHEGNTNIWLTPLYLIQSLGAFDYDPCGYPNHITAKKIICLPENGLKEKWEGRVWLNPPYGRNIHLWLNKFALHKNGIALVFGRTDTKWFHSLHPDAIFFLEGRIKFMNADFKIVTNAGHGSILIAYGQHNVTAFLNSKLKGTIYKLL